MAIGNIYYLIPDLSPPKLDVSKLFFRRPRVLAREIWRRSRMSSAPIIGGIKIHYQHCDMLRDLGYRAYPVLMGKRKPYDFGYKHKSLSIDKLGYKLNCNDVVVGTEFCPYEALTFEGGKKVVFVQNWVNLAPNRRFKPEDESKDYKSMGYDHVASCSQYIKHFIKQKMGIDSDLIINGININKFVPDETQRIENRVLYMPRKNRQDIKKIRKILSTENLNFVAADGLSEDELIKEFQKADIFIASGYPEGFGLPPLEAMACGCAVVGFTGKGASEFMIHNETAMVAPDGNCHEVARQLMSLVENKELKETIRHSGLEISKRYSLQFMQQDIFKFYKKLEMEL